MKTSTNGVNLIKGLEGFRAEAYSLGDGGWTIGYGTYNVPGVAAGTVWSVERATEQLLADLVRFESAVNGIGANLNQNQFDALVSFTYNLGAGWITQYPSMPNALRQGDWQYVTDSMMNFVMPGTQFEAGLTRRRKIEVDYFYGHEAPETSDNQDPTPTVSTAIQQFQAYGGQFTAYHAFRVDELSYVNGIWQAINYELAGGTDYSWAYNGIPAAIIDRTDSYGNITDNQVLSVGAYAKFNTTYNHGFIDEYDVASNGVGINFSGYGLIWLDADALLKL